MGNPNCCNEYWNIQIQSEWLASFPERGFKKTDNRRYGLIVKELMCQGCKAHQPFLTYKNIVTVQAPVYPKEDESCVDDQSIKETGRLCKRKRKVEEGGEGRYTVERSETYNLYVSEQTARILYYGTQAPNEDAFLVPSDHTNEAFDEVQLADYPN